MQGRSWPCSADSATPSSVQRERLGALALTHPPSSAGAMCADVASESSRRASPAAGRPRHHHQRGRYGRDRHTFAHHCLGVGARWTRLLAAAVALIASRAYLLRVAGVAMAADSNTAGPTRLDLPQLQHGATPSSVTVRVSVGGRTTLLRVPPGIDSADDAAVLACSVLRGDRSGDSDNCVAEVALQIQNKRRPPVVACVPVPDTLPALPGLIAEEGDPDSVCAAMGITQRMFPSTVPAGWDAPGSGRYMCEVLLEEMEKRGADTSAADEWDCAAAATTAIQYARDTMNARHRVWQQPMPQTMPRAVVDVVVLTSAADVPLLEARIVELNDTVDVFAVLDTSQSRVVHTHTEAGGRLHAWQQRIMAVNVNGPVSSDVDSTHPSTRTQVDVDTLLRGVHAALEALSAADHTLVVLGNLGQLPRAEVLAALATDPPPGAVRLEFPRTFVASMHVEVAPTRRAAFGSDLASYESSVGTRSGCECADEAACPVHPLHRKLSEALQLDGDLDRLAADDIVSQACRVGPWQTLAFSASEVPTDAASLRAWCPDHSGDGRGADPEPSSADLEAGPEALALSHRDRRVTTLGSGGWQLVGFGGVEQTGALRTAVERMCRDGVLVERQPSWWRDASVPMPRPEVLATLELASAGDDHSHGNDNNTQPLLLSAKGACSGESTVWAAVDGAGSATSEGRQFEFIEIGTSEFDTLTEALPEDSDARGISVEPVDEYLQRLPSRRNVVKVNAAMSLGSAGGPDVLPVWYVAPADIDAHEMPPWARGCNALGEPHPTMAKLLRERGLEHLWQTRDVRVLSFGQLCAEHGVGRVRMLKVDTEGADVDIMRGVIAHCVRHPAAWPEWLQFESNVLSDGERVESLIRDLEGYGYAVRQRGHDTVMTRARET